MSSMLCDAEIRRIRKGLRVYYFHADCTPEECQDLLDQPGENLKSLDKSSVKKVGEWVIKSSGTPQPLRTIKHTFQRARYRRAWIAAHHLLKHGVSVPRPLAFIETDVVGIICGHQMISAHLSAHRNVEDYMRSMVEQGGGGDTITLFLERLADAINRITDSGAYHADLSGKNIFTANGNNFVFIDLDAVELGVEYTDELRMKNHVQLYDSFCDMLRDTLLTPFIARLLTEKQDLRVWMPKVRKGQAERREKQIALWAKQGKV